MKNIGPREFKRINRANIGRSHDKTKIITNKEKRKSNDLLKNRSLFVTWGLVSIR